MKIIVTGSSGTIGTALCEALLDQGHDVVGVDWKPNKWSDRVQGITRNADLRDRKAVEATLPKDGERIVHLAANARVYDLVVDPQRAQDNIETTFNVLEFARVHNIKQFVFASSREVYGNSDKEIHSEDESNTKYCESPYTASKIAGESLVHAYSQCYGIDFIIVRFSNVYGKYDDSDRIIPLFIRKTRNNETLTVFGKDKKLDFTYISDVINALTLLFNKFQEVNGEVYNIASGKGTSLVDVAHIIQEKMGSEKELDIKDNRTGEVVRYIANIDKINKAVGYESQVSIEEGVQKSIDWYQSRQETWDQKK